MRRFSRAASMVAVLAALTAAAVAIAAPSGTRSTKSVSASFTATTVKHSKATTCTGGDGAYTVTHAVYTGTSTSSDPRLSGAIQLNVDSVLNTTSNLGWLRGRFRIRNTSHSGSADGSITGVLSSGTLQGFAVGRLHGPHPSPGSTPTAPARLLGNLTASYSPGSGFTGGSLGAGGATDTAIETSGSCPSSSHPAAPHHAKPHHLKPHHLGRRH